MRIPVTKVLVGMDVMRTFKAGHEHSQKLCQQKDGKQSDYETSGSISRLSELVKGLEIRFVNFPFFRT